ncbi:hypothetical protein QBC35DRAFT_550381 [Podospora australis]|uniref:Uncharacterized protein n=1 Tax=Podospora australis TaxID=1536484 RepID=A0AAN6WXT6_9PEZI|nr:hypothetical protein QBC35DRAFT_550381 [Podospora australis]
MGLLKKLFTRKHKESNDRSITLHNPPNPFPDEGTFTQIRSHVLSRAAANDPSYLALMRQAAFQTPFAWLEANFPAAKGFFICSEPIPYPYGDISVDDNEGTVINAEEDTRIYLAGKPGVGTVCVKMMVIPPKNVGSGETRGLPFARDTLGTPAMDAAEGALLGLMRRWQEENGEKGTPGVEDGCLAVVVMGVDMLVWEYSRERGFYDPPGGFVFEK